MATNNNRTLIFPADRSVGWVKVPKIGPDPHNYWELVSDATGEVVVPTKSPVRLVVEPSSAVDLSWLQNLQPHDLSELCLVQTEVQDDQLRHVSRLNGLQVLILSHPFKNVGDSGVAHLQSLLQLRELYLNATDVSDIGLSYLRGLTRLEVLSIGATHVSDAGLSCLYELPNLKRISFETAYSHRKSKVTSMGLSLLQQALPDCIIVTDDNWRSVGAS